MNIRRLVEKSKIGTHEGIDLIDEDKLSKWLFFRKKISQREEGLLYLAELVEGENRQLVVVKEHDNYECLKYEYLVGQRINSLIPDCPNFLTTHVFFLTKNKEEYSSYLILEYVKGEQITKIMHSLSEREYFEIIYQLTLILMMAQEKIKFVHYDLHSENVIYQKLDYPQEIGYLVKGKKIFLKTSFLLRIIDYGCSHAGKLKIPKEQLKVCIHEDTLYDGRIPGCFDPLIDVLSFASSSRYGDSFRLRTFLIDFSESNDLSLDGRENWRISLPGNEITNLKDQLTRQIEKLGATNKNLEEISYFPILLDIYIYPRDTQPINRKTFLEEYQNAIENYYKEIVILEDYQNEELVEINTEIYSELLTNHKQYLLNYRNDKDLSTFLSFLEKEK